MSFSLCLIALDAEQTLPRCLGSVRGHVDEIIVVDTGSTDRTKEIAEEAGAKVFDFTAKTHPKSFRVDDFGPRPHTGKLFLADFSAARNFSFEKATGDHIMWLDADDELLGAEELSTAVQAMEHGFPSIFLPYEHPGGWRWWRERVVPRDLRWQGPVHEALPVTGRHLLNQPRVLHHGRSGRTGGVASRNYKILLAHLTHDLDQAVSAMDPRLLYHLGDEARKHGNVLLAMDAWEWAVRGLDDASYRCRARTGLGRILSEEGDYEQAASVLELARTDDPYDPGPWFELGRIAFRRRDWRGCIELLDRGLEQKPGLGILWTDPLAMTEARKMRQEALDQARPGALS